MKRFKHLFLGRAGIRRGVSFWGRCLKPGCCIHVRVSAGKELLITRACSATPQKTLGAGVNSKLSLRLVGPSMQQRFTVDREGINLFTRLSGGRHGASWTLEMLSSGAEQLHVMGFLRKEQQPLVAKRKVAAQSAKHLRTVHLPVGWAGLSFRVSPCGRLLVTDIPKTCFSSAAFGATASAQVSGVNCGDEIVRINGDPPALFAKRIASAKDSLNACWTASPPHEVGTLDKYAAPPCVSCDFVRRHADLGLDAALMLWMRAAKRNTPIVLGVRTPPKTAVADETLPLPPQETLLAVPRVKRDCDSGALGDAQAPPRKRVLTESARTIESSGPAVASDVIPPQVTPIAKAIYNPLRPAAARALTPARTTQEPVAAAPKQPPVLKVSAGGFTCEERKLGQGGDVSRIGSLVTFRYNIRLPRSASSRGGGAPTRRAPKKEDADKGETVAERGEIKCRLGEAEVLDGWMDGNVDIEEVLASWSRGLAGMRLGGTRRICIPAKSGFKDGGGDAIPKGKELFFDVDLKKLE